MILVLGGGFGLYGHVAALATDGRPVATLSRYRRQALERPEMEPWLDVVQWLDDESEAIRAADAVFLVRRPEDNAALASQMAKDGTGGHLIIEKPMAPDPQSALALERRLLAAGRLWAIPYLFPFCAWYPLIEQALSQGRSVIVRWRHRQSGDAQSWKHDPDAGGGALPFYFIHCLALLEALMPQAHARLERHGGKKAGRIALHAGSGAVALSISFELAHETRFQILAADAIIWESSSPFGAVPMRGQVDPRVPVLRAFYRRLDSEGFKAFSHFAQRITRRWADLGL